MHTCNPWCFGGLHALLFDTEISERAAIGPVAQQLARQSRLEMVSFDEIRPTGQPAPGTPTQQGVARGRMVIWAR
jgi:hypothetical protein